MLAGDQLTPLEADCLTSGTYVARLRSLTIEERFDWHCQGKAPVGRFGWADRRCVGATTSEDPSRGVVVADLPNAGFGNVVDFLGAVPQLALQSRRRFAIRVTDSALKHALVAVRVAHYIHQVEPNDCFDFDQGTVYPHEYTSTPHPAMFEKNMTDWWHSAVANHTCVAVHMQSILLDTRWLLGRRNSTTTTGGDLRSCWFDLHRGCLSPTSSTNRDWMLDDRCSTRALFTTMKNHPSLPTLAPPSFLEKSFETSLVSSERKPSQTTAADVVVGLHVRVGDCYGGNRTFRLSRDCAKRQPDRRVTDDYDWPAFFECVYDASSTILHVSNWTLFIATDYDPLVDDAVAYFSSNHHIPVTSARTIGVLAHTVATVKHSNDPVDDGASIDPIFERVFADYYMLTHASLTFAGRSSFGNTAALVSGLPFVDYRFEHVDTCRRDWLNLIPA